MYLFVDTETGGVDPSLHSLLEWSGIVTDEHLVERGRLTVHVRPPDGNYHVTAEALGVNHINLIDHYTKAIHWKDARTQIIDFLGRHACTGERLMVAGWNVGFDVSFTKQCLAMEPMWNRYCGYSHLDVASVVHFLFGLRGLHKTADALDVPVRAAHVSINDVETTIGVYQVCLNTKRVYIDGADNEAVVAQD